MSKLGYVELKKEARKDGIGHSVSAASEDANNQEGNGSEDDPGPGVRVRVTQGKHRGRADLEVEASHCHSCGSKHWPSGHWSQGRTTKEKMELQL